MKDLVEVGVSMAMRGAKEYLDRHGLTAEPEALRECLKSWLKLQMPVALRDAREAFACHMDKVAEATFAASMVQAGIEAAKEAGYPVKCPREIARGVVEVNPGQYRCNL